MAFCVEWLAGGARQGQGMYITLTLGLASGTIFSSILIWELRRSEQSVGRFEDQPPWWGCEGADLT